MSEIVLSIVLFGIASGVLWQANRCSSPRGSHGQAASATVVPNYWQVARGPVFFTAVLVYWGLTALLARPLSVFGISILGIILLYAGNALKVRLLGEVLVFSDVFLVGHALRFPRLYFGYVPKWVWAALILILIILISEIVQEPSSASLRKAGALIFIFGMGWAWFAWRRTMRQAREFLQSYQPTYCAQSDAARFTPIGAAFVHVIGHLSGAAEVRQRFGLRRSTDLESHQHKRETIFPPQTNPRHFVLIQAESYCPAGELLGRKTTTPVIDAFRASDYGGRLLLDWRGAYTMRTEFSVLTGLKTTALGSYAFDPYQLARCIPMDSLARDFRAMGYDTVVWHPNDGRFFDRFTVMPHLGFSSLMDINAFADLPREGHYIGDKALLEKAAEFLASRTRPTFLFIVTIEAHGPWKGRAETQLREYEAHLANLDAGLDYLTMKLAATHPGSTVALYGDHLPSLSAFHTAEPATAWFAHVCGNRADADRIAKDLPVQDLRQELLAFHCRHGEVIS